VLVCVGVGVLDGTGVGVLDGTGVGVLDGAGVGVLDGTGVGVGVEVGKGIGDDGISDLFGLQHKSVNENDSITLIINSLLTGNIKSPWLLVILNSPIYELTFLVNFLFNW